MGFTWHNIPRTIERLSAMHQERAVGMLQVGLSAVEVARRLQVHKCTVSRLLQDSRRQGPWLIDYVPGDQWKPQLARTDTSGCCISTTEYRKQNTFISVKIKCVHKIVHRAHILGYIDCSTAQMYNK